ncbi:hypothetical protein RB195_015094 [Necator americanus]|uniref:GIY-YIG domain-containing protein n=1 Tax=Necator americanus TaxID=51031 RepID=A0ABR1E2X6_NECAM
MINATSAHPIGMKKAIMRNMVKTATALCKGERERAETLELAIGIASLSGYTRSKSNTQSRATNKTMRIPREDRIPLCIPFVSDYLMCCYTLDTTALRDDVVLVNISNDSTKRQLVRNRFYDRQCMSECCAVCPFAKTGDCTKVVVIYQIECQRCNVIYVGETGRMLNLRIKQHLAGRRRDSSVTIRAPQK